MTSTRSTNRGGQRSVSLTHYFTLFREDAARWVRLEQITPLEEVDLSTMAKLLWHYRPLRAMAWFRLGSWANAARLPGATGLIQRHIARVYGLEISPGADIGGGLYVAHPVGCTIAVQRMGRNVSVIAAATIGKRTSPEWPRIGDHVYVGAGARVLGGIDVGDGAVIGANAVVIKDVRPGTTVVGVPARETRSRELL